MYIEEDLQIPTYMLFFRPKGTALSLKSRMLLTLATGQLIVVLPDSVSLVCIWIGSKIETRILVCLCVLSAFLIQLLQWVSFKKKMIILTMILLGQ